MFLENLLRNISETTNNYSPTVDKKISKIHLAIERRKHDTNISRNKNI